MSAGRFPQHDTQTRLALVEHHLQEQDDKLLHVVEQVDHIRSDFSELRVELARHRVPSSRPEGGLVIPKWLLIAILGLLPGLGAGCVELVKLALGK